MNHRILPLQQQQVYTDYCEIPLGQEKNIGEHSFHLIIFQSHKTKHSNPKRFNGGGFLWEYFT